MHVLAGVSAGLAVSVQLLLLRMVWRTAERRRSYAALLTPEVAQLSLQWNAVLAKVFVAARETIALCPVCHLGAEGTCVCPDRRQALAIAVAEAEEFASAHGPGRGSRCPAGGN